MSTLATLRTKLSRALHDESEKSFDDNTLNDLINQGIAALSRFYPREAVDTSITLSAGVSSYTTSVTFTKIYRVDIYNSASTYLGTLPARIDNPDSGWEWHAEVLWLPPRRTYTTGDTLKVFGYAGYASLTLDSDEPTFDETGEAALMVYGQMEGFSRLLQNRSAFQQWQASPQNRDVTALALAQIYSGAQRRWEMEVRALRRMRKN